MLSRWLTPLSACLEVLLLHPSPLDGSPPWFPCPSAYYLVYVPKPMGCQSQRLPGGTDGFRQCFLTASMPVTGGLIWTKHCWTVLCIPGVILKAQDTRSPQSFPEPSSPRGNPEQQRRLRTLPCLCSEGAASGLEQLVENISSPRLLLKSCHYFFLNETCKSCGCCDCLSGNSVLTQLWL